MAEINAADVKQALKATRPRKVMDVGQVIILVLCVTLMSFVSFVAMYQYAREKAHQVEQLSTASECRSRLAAETDVAQGKFLADLGLVNLSTARALAALGQRSSVAEMVEELEANSDALDRTLAAYALQIEARAKTADTCNTR